MSNGNYLFKFDFTCMYFKVVFFLKVISNSYVSLPIEDI